MKQKKIVFINALALVFLLVACASNIPASQSQPAPQQGTFAPKLPPTGTWTAEPETSTPAPTFTPRPLLINSNNITRIKPSKQISQPNPYKVTWSSDGTLIGAVSQSDSNQTNIYLYNTSALEPVSNTVLVSPFVLLDYSPDKRLAAVTTDFISIDLRDLSSGTSVRTLNPGPLTSASFSVDGKLLLVCSAEYIQVILFDVASGSMLRTVTGYDTAAPVYDAFLSFDSTSLIWHSRANIRMMRLFDQQFGPNLDHEDFVISFDLTRDKHLLGAATDGTIGSEIVPFVQLWDPSSGTELGRLRTGQDVAQSLSFSPSGELLAVAAGKTLAIWNTADQNKLFELIESSSINEISFSPDGYSLAIALADGTLALMQITK